jgi:hypothetical protein
MIDLPEDQYATQRQVLQNSLIWRSDRLGQTESAAWGTTKSDRTGLLAKALDDLRVL